MGSRTAVYFRGSHSVMEMQGEITKRNYVLDVMEQQCVTMVDMGNFIVKFTGDAGIDIFTCIKSISRSKSVLQLRTSRNSAELDQTICAASNLILDT